VLAAMIESNESEKSSAKCGQLSCGQYCEEQGNRTAPHNTCQCHYGYRLDNETRTCVLVRSCEQSLHVNSTVERCEHICKNILDYDGSPLTYNCKCYPGYYNSPSTFRQFHSKKTKCTVDHQSAELYYSSGREIRGFDLDTKNTFRFRKDILTERAGEKITAILITKNSIYYTLSWMTANNHSHFSLFSVSFLWVLCKDRLTISQ